MTFKSTLRHAVLLADNEVGDGPEFRLERPRPTAVRGPVALADVSGRIFAVGALTDVRQHDRGGGGRLTRYDWIVVSVERLERPFRVDVQTLGPVWVRLGKSERARAAGEVVEDILADPPIEAESRTIHVPPSEQASDRVGDVNLEPATDELELRALKPLAEVAEDDDWEGAASDLLHDDADEDGSAPPQETTPEFRTETEAQSTIAEFKDAVVDVDGEPAQSVSTPVASSPPEVPQPLSERVFLSAARERAIAFVPQRMLTEENARQLLIQLRETEIKATFPDAKANSGILRKTLLDRMIDEAIESEADFNRLIPRDVRMATDYRQLQAYLEPIVQILSKVR